MTIRQGWVRVAAVGVSLVLLAGCSSGSNSAGTTAATTSAAVSSPAAGSGAMTTVGGDTTEFDGETTTWFDTLCTGIAPLSELQSTLSTATSSADLGAAMSAVGSAFQDTAGRLSSLPPPTFEGGDALADTVQTGLQSFGQTFTDFSLRAAALNEGDTAGLQQFQTDLMSELSQSPIAQLDATPQVQAQIKEIPSCQPVFGS